MCETQIPDVNEWPLVLFGETLKPSKRHRRNPTRPEYTLCGWCWVDATYKQCQRDATHLRVTCKKCLQIWEGTNA
jgi:hypothetical protein